METLLLTTRIAGKVLVTSQLGSKALLLQAPNGSYTLNAKEAYTLAEDLIERPDQCAEFNHDEMLEISAALLAHAERLTSFVDVSPAPGGLSRAGNQTRTASFSHTGA